MNLFNKKKTFDFDEKSAPKVNKIQLKLNCALEIPNGWSDTKTASKLSVDKQLICDTDESKEKIKEEVAQELENLFVEISKQIDANNSELTNEFWYNLKLQNIKE